MTLVTRALPPAYHKKTVGHHHKQSKSYHKTYWPYLPLLLIVGFGLLLNNILPGKSAVLGYATDMSVQSLLDDTNSQRQSNNESALALNQILNNAAQAKAQDMATRNYWSHNTPDGQEPWTFMVAAGYNYQLAGENLAYGFSTASDTLTGWMNSPGHRANILNAGYTEVGFGYINIANYQSNGPETLVVAMYGAPQVLAANAAANTDQTVQGAKPPSTSQQPVAASTTTPAAQATGSSAGTATQPTTTPVTPPTAGAAPTTQQTAVVTPQQVKVNNEGSQNVSRLDLLSAGKAAPWSVALVSVIGIAAFVLFLLRHGIAWHKLFVKGEKFVLHHPLLDVTLVALITAMFLLIHHSGTIR